MKSVALVSSLLLAGLAANAQPRPQGNMPVTTTPVRDTAGGSLIIRNQSTQTVTAVVYIYTMRTADSSVVYAATGYYDSATEPSMPALKPGQEIRLPYRIPFTGATPVVGPDAVLFADGTSFGEPNVVQSITDRRNYTLVSLNKSINELKQALKDGVTRQALINQFQTSIAMETSNAADVELATCIQQVRSQVVAGLISGGRRPDGTAVPVDELIQAQINSLGARREALRAALMPK